MTSRSLIKCPASEPIKLFADLWEELLSGVMVLGQDRSHLQQLLPPSQEMMPARSMKDSLTLARIPLGSCADVRLKYKSTIGGARLGQLLQDCRGARGCRLLQERRGGEGREIGLQIGPLMIELFLMRLYHSIVLSSP